MATVKVKLRESTVGGKAGVIYYQLCHRRKSQQVTTSMRLQPRQWDARRGCVITPLSGEAHALLSVQQRIDRDLCLLHTIIRDFEFRQEGYSLRDVVDRFRKSRRSTVLAYVETQAARLEANGKLGTARNYRRTLGSFSDFLGGRDIPFSLVDERLVGQYDDWLRRRGVVRNTVSFYMRILRAVYNRAVKEDVVPQADPFRHVYTGVDQTCKRAVGEDVIVRLRQLDLTRGYDPLCSPQDRAAPRYPYRALHREAYRALCRCRAHIRLCFSAAQFGRSGQGVFPIPYGP